MCVCVGGGGGGGGGGGEEKKEGLRVHLSPDVDCTRDCT